MSVLGWALFGFVLGLLARAVLPESDPPGLLSATLVGIIGGVVAGWIGTAAGFYDFDQSGGFIAAAIGAVVALSLFWFIGRRRHQRAVERVKAIHAHHPHRRSTDHRKAA